MKRFILFSISSLICFLSTAQDLNLIDDVVEKDNITAEISRPVTVTDEIPNSVSTYSLMDTDGNLYKVVKIGDQFWMAENLKTTKFNDGTEIPIASDYKNWSSLMSPGYCWYYNEAENFKADYGALYNWYTINTDKLCPSGWHVPSIEEWKTLTSYYDESTVGGELKEKGTKYWMSPNTGATNAAGFGALPGGSRGSLGSFFDEGLRGYWWSSTESDKNRAWYSALGYSSKEASGNSDNKKGGLSVRCVKD